MRRARPLRGAAHRLLGALGATVVFVLVATASLVLHGDRPTTRRFAARVVTRLLAPIFEGQILVRQIDHLGFDGVDIGSAEVRDPWGQTVISAQGLHARVPVVTTVRRLLTGAGSLWLVIDEVRVDRGDVVLDRGPDGRNRIAAAFTPRPSAGPVTFRPSTPSARHIELPHIVIGYVQAHGEPVAGVPIDAEGTRVPGRLLVTERSVDLDVDLFGLRSRFLAPLNPSGTATYHLRIAEYAPVQMWTNFHGTVGQATVDLSARLSDDELSATLDAARVTPDELRSLLPTSPLQGEIAVHADVKGTLPDLHASVRAVAGASEVKVEADARFVDGIEADARWSARDIDPRLFAPNVPAASLGGDGRVRLRLDPAGLRASLDASLFPFLLDNQVVPGVTLEGTYDGAQLQGKAQILEPGVDADLSFTFDPKSRITEAEVDLRIPQLSSVPRLGGALGGSVQTHLKALLTSTGSLHAQASGTYQNLGRDGVRVGSGTFLAHATGPLDQLYVSTDIRGHQLSLGGFDVAHFNLTSGGAPAAPSVRLRLEDPRWTRLEVSAGVRLGARPTLSQVTVGFQGGDLTADAHAASVETGGGAVTLKGLDITGPALRAQGEVRVGSAGLTVRLHDGFVDLVRLGHFLAPRLGRSELADTSAGTLEFSADLDAEGPRRSGFIDLKLRGLCYQNHPAVLEGQARLALQDEQASATTTLHLLQATCGLAPDQPDPLPHEQLATARAQAIGTLRGSILDARVWQQATGRLELQELSAQLDKISAHPVVDARRDEMAHRPQPAILPRFGGTLLAAGSVTRLDPRVLPVTHLDLLTQQLRLDFGPPGADATLTLPEHHEPGAPSRLARLRHIEGLDLRTTLDLTPAPEAGALATETKVYLRNGERELAKVTLATTLVPGETSAHLAALLGPDDSPARQQALAWLKAQPARGTFAWRDTPFEQLPEVIRPRRLRGRAQLEGSFEGSADRPAVTARLAVADLHREESGWDIWRLGATIDATLDERGMVARAALDHRADNVPQSEGTVSLWVMTTKRLGDLLWDRGSRWQVDAQATFDRWRLESLPPLAALGLQGQLSGVAQALRMHVQPAIWVDLRLDRGQIYDAPLAPTQLIASLVEGGGFATLTITQPPPRPGATGGQLALTTFPTVHFEQALWPALDPSRPHPISLQLTNFDLEPFAPLAAPVLADLQGKLDGEISMLVAARREDNTLAGRLHWTQGVLLIPQLGQTFHRGQFRLSTTAQNDRQQTLVSIDDLSLAATTGRITGGASFTVPNDLLARYVFPRSATDTAPGEALPSVQGRFHANIAAQEKIPVTFEGVALGDAHGRAEGTLAFNAEGVAVRVAVPDLTFELPDTTSQQNVQDLASNPEIGVLDVRRRRGRTSASEADARPRKITIVLGLGSTLDELDAERAPSGSVLVRRASIDARVAGVTRLSQTDELTMTGTLETISGHIVALGKPFELRRGFVRFEGQPTNPYLNIGAYWDAPTGTRVFADIQGYLKEAQLRLRSEPARPESEVLSLVLFGRDASVSTQFGGTNTNNSNGLAVGSGVASTLLNSFFDPVQVFGRRVEMRVESTANRGTVIGFATEVRPRLWVQADASTATQRERQNADLSAYSLDWRFRPDWSLRTTVGDRGSSLMELLWQFKY